MSREKDPSAIKFGLTGGIGSGKSTVSERLSELGAVIFDADGIVKELQQPGQRGFVAMVDILGEEIINEAGELDKKKVASLIFPNPHLKQQVEQVIHPMVWEIMNEGASNLKPDEIAVFDVPLLKKESTTDMVGVVVVNTSIELAVERAAKRTIEGRTYNPDEIRERIRAQISNEERLEMADFVVVNNGSLAELNSQINEAWSWMRQSASQGQALPHPSINGGAHEL